MSFSFSFSGDDIEDVPTTDADPPVPNHAAETGQLRKRAPSTAFPISGQPLLTPQAHSLESLLESLPSKIQYSTLNVKLDDGTEVRFPRRELWDVRVQLMAEDDEEGLGNLGKDDVKTGVYEGGFKSWESSVDLVRVLAARRGELLAGDARRILELGCGTALPTLAVFQWALQSSAERSSNPLHLSFADYNPTVLRLVTLPNILLSWAQTTHQEREGPWEPTSELEITESLLAAFAASLQQCNISLTFYSGAWSPSFVSLVQSEVSHAPASLTIIGAETIYSPAALKAFAETLIAVLMLDKDTSKSMALVGAKMVYFGVGGSVEDFCDLVVLHGASVERIRMEEDGVRRAVVKVCMAEIEA
ncbi:putative mitotic exit network interactor 1 [Coleophoma cylindrospora]|uniref:protein-histidine N-methyltransferase n=1 Tax=Coleophoma cylindrospora TaxID=1849047 RepID=A0A3D8SDH3_9HELO|nr:putative mitotic exit network interactor 1 [Coleophoma cylindrospora]